MPTIEEQNAIIADLQAKLAAQDSILKSKFVDPAPPGFLTFFVLHGNHVHNSGIKKPGELIVLSYLEAKELVRQKTLKRYEPNIDKLVDYTKDSTVDVAGRKLPTLEEYIAGGFDPDHFDGYIAKLKAEAKGQAQQLPIKPLSLEEFVRGGLRAEDYDDYLKFVRKAQETKLAQPPAAPLGSELAPSAPPTPAAVPDAPPASIQSVADMVKSGKSVK